MPPDNSRGIGALEAGQLDARERMSDVLFRVRPRDALEPERQPYIVEHVRPWRQRRLLEYEAQARLAAPLHIAGGIGGQSGDDPQHRRLAAARGAEQREELAVADVEIDVLQRDRSALEGFADSAQADQRRSADASVSAHGGPPLQGRLGMQGHTAKRPRPSPFRRSSPTASVNMACACRLDKDVPGAARRPGLALLLGRRGGLRRGGRRGGRRLRRGLVRALDLGVLAQLQDEIALRLLLDVARACSFT